MALEALSNVIKHNRGVDIQCIGHFKLLFSLLRLRRCPKIQEMALQVFFIILGVGLGSAHQDLGFRVLDPQISTLGLVFEKLISKSSDTQTNISGNGCQCDEKQFCANEAGFFS